MSFKALFLAAAFSVTAASAFAGNTSALDLPKAESSMSMTSATSAPAIDMTAGTNKVEDIVAKCRFVNTARSTYCDAFKQSN